MFILRPTAFAKFKITVGELNSFHVEEFGINIYHFYSPSKGVFMGKPFSINKKGVKNIILFLSYNTFVYYYKNLENYINNEHIYKHFIKLMNYKIIGLKPKDFIPEAKVVLLSNHGYNKMLDILFVFDVLFSLRTKITYERHLKYYHLSEYQPTFIFHGLLLLERYERPELVSIMYKYVINNNSLQVSRYDYSFLLEKNSYIDKILEKINTNDNVSSIIKQYFSIYRQFMNDLTDNSDVYTVKDKYELDNVPYSSIVSNEKHILKKYTLYPCVNPPYSYIDIHRSTAYIDDNLNINTQRDLNYYIIILFSRAITKIITPNELNHNIELVKAKIQTNVSQQPINVEKLTINSINVYTDNMYFIDKKDNDSFVLVYDNQNLKNIKPIKSIDKKEFVAKILKKQIDNLHLYFLEFKKFDEVEYELENFYEDTYNWKYVFYLKLKFLVEQKKDVMYFNIGTLQEVNIKLFGHSFSGLFIRYVIKIVEYNGINIDIESNQSIIFSETYLDVLPQYYVNFFIDEDDIKQINEFTSNIMYKYYKDYDKYDNKLPIYAYGGEFNLKIIINKYLFNSDVYKKSLETIEFYKNNLLYNAFTIINYEVNLTQDTIINDHYRSIEFVRLLEHGEKIENTTTITLLMQNDDYISKGIYRFKSNGIGSMFRLFVSIAIPKNKFDGILQEIQSADKIEIEGVFLINSIGNVLYLNGFVEKIHCEK